MKQKSKLDLSTALGLGIAVILVVVAIMIGGSIGSFFNAPSLLIVIGGTFAVTTACFSLPEIMRSQLLFVRTIVYNCENPTDSARRVLEYAESARKNNILSLQNQLAAGNIPAFLEKGLSMVIDGLPMENIQRILQQDIMSMMDRHSTGVAIFRKTAEIAPAMGLIGTLIGLVQMLGNLEDPSSIGPAMAVALLTTMYGAMLAYMVFSPMASKLERITKEETLVNNIYLKGIISIGSQENPRQLETLINTLLPPEKRIHYFE